MTRTTTSAGSSTREQILTVARDLMRTRSYLGFSFQDVADLVGVRKASLYHHFQTKETLGIEVLREAIRWFREWSAQAGTTPEQKLVAFFDLHRNGLAAGQAVCPTCAVAPGWDCVNDDLKRAVRDLRSAQILWLTGVLGALPVVATRVSDDPPVSQIAAHVFAVCQGAMLTARMTGDVADFDEAVAPLKRSLLG
ncbi:MAG: TetR/AcrR family transcriptional regulator [Burkholderiales bacterium]|nr:TetR/AcrR family transcriptional regulator [Burkholderiales bacterium]